MNVIVFTNNQKKCEEMQYILQALNVNVFPYKQITGDHIDVVEDGDTFEENAIKKVKALDHLSGILIADDSGLEVDALGGAPGIYSARYGGPDLSDTQRCEFLLNNMKGNVNRTARFVCVIAFILPGKDAITIKGVVEGDLSETIEEGTGYGYDPIFIPKGYSQTFSALGVKVKQSMSHRGQALRETAKVLEAYFNDESNLKS